MSIAYLDTSTMEVMRRFHPTCLERGAYLHYVSPHHGYSSAHTLADIEETLNVMDDAAKGPV